MAIVQYATEEQFADWLDKQGRSIPDNADALLTSASLVVAEATINQYYNSDADTMLPTDQPVIDAFADATCAQAAVWVALGIDPNLAGVDRARLVKSSTMLGDRVDYDTTFESSTTAFAATQAVISELCPDAQRILRQASLLSTRVWTYG